MFGFSELDPPEVALIRAAARSPRALEHSNTTTYQVLKSHGSVSSNAEPKSGGGSSKIVPKDDVEKNDGFKKISGGDQDSIVAKLDEKLNQKVETWEEVEVPKFPQRDDDALSKAALTPAHSVVAMVSAATT